MNIIIKGMDMPGSCDRCKFICSARVVRNTTLPGYVCALGDFDIDDYRLRHKDCPLSEIPTPHGRLIDADVLINDLQGLRKLFPSTGMDYIGGVISLVQNTPAIIEAEGP